MYNCIVETSFGDKVLLKAYEEKDLCGEKQVFFIGKAFSLVYGDYLEDNIKSVIGKVIWK